MFQSPISFARPQQLPAGYPYYAPGIVPAGFVPVAQMATPWVSPGGQIAPAGQTQTMNPAVYYQSLSTTMQLLIVMSAGFSAYHGYKRNRDNVGWGFGWGALGTLFPVIVPIVAIAQGYAKPASSR